MERTLSNLELSLIPEFPLREVLRSNCPQTLPPAAQMCGLWIFLVGISSTSSGGVDLRRSKQREFGYYSLAHLHGGGGVHWRAESGLQLAQPGDVVFSLPGERHIYGPRHGEEWREDWLAFTGPRADMLRAGGMLESGVLKNALANRRVRDIARLAREQTYEGLLRAAMLLELLLADLHLSCQQRRTAGALEKIQFLAGEIDAFPERVWTLPEMAAEAGVSVSHLRRLFLNAFQTSPHAYLEQSRLRRAAALLCDSALPIAAVAEHTGYPDPFHFSTRFRRYYGFTPTTYRQLSRNGGRPSALAERRDTQAKKD